MWRNGPAGPKTLCNACGVRAGRLRNSGRARAGAPPRRAGAGAAGSGAGERGGAGAPGQKRKAARGAGGAAARRKPRKAEGPLEGGGAGPGAPAGQKKSHHKQQARPAAPRLRLPGGGEWVGDGSGGRAALGRFAGQRACGRRAALLAGDTRIEVVRPGPVEGLGGVNLLLDGRRSSNVSVSLSDDLQPGQKLAGVRVNVSHGGRMRTGCVIRPEGSGAEGGAAGPAGSSGRSAAAPAAAAGGSPSGAGAAAQGLPAPAAPAGSPGVVTAEPKLPGGEGTRNAATGRWEWAVTPRWSLDFGSREALEALRSEVQRHLALLAATSAPRPGAVRGAAAAPIAIPGVRPAGAGRGDEGGEEEEAEAEAEEEAPGRPAFALPATYIRRSEGAVGPTCSARAHLYEADEEDRAWLADLARGAVDCRALVASVCAGEAARERAGVPSRSPSSATLAGLVTGPATPPLAEGRAADPRVSTPEPMEVLLEGRGAAAAAAAAGAGAAKEASANSAGAACRHEKEGSTGGGHHQEARSGSPALPEAEAEAEVAEGGAVDQGAPGPDLDGARLTEGELEQCIDAMEHVAALARRPHLGQAEALRLLRACPWAPGDEAALQVAHAYWVAKLKGRGFRALVAHYHRVPPPGWREPRVTTHAFEFVVGPPRPAERRAAIASQRRKVARRSGRGNPVMSLLEGQPIKHDHRSGVACLACRLKQLSKQEGAGQARAILAAELGLVPKGDGAADALALARKAAAAGGMVTPGPASAMGGALSGARPAALKVARAGAGAPPGAAAREDSCSVGEGEPLRLLPLTPGLGAPAPKRRRTPRARTASSVKQARDPEPILLRA